MSSNTEGNNKETEYSDGMIELIELSLGNQLPNNPQQKKKLFEEKRKSMVVTEERLKQKPKISVTQMIENIEKAKREFEEETVTDERIGDLFDSREKSNLHELRWQSNPNSIFYRLDGITKHEIGNTIGEALGYMTMFVSEDYPQEIELSWGPLTKEDAARLADAPINFFKITERALKEGDTEVSIEELMGTFRLSDKTEEGKNEFVVPMIHDTKVVFDGDWQSFDSFEEFLSIRTLIHNALKEGDVTQVNVSKDTDPETSKTVYTVTDNGPKSDNFLGYAKDFKFGYELGRRYPESPGFTSARGGSIIAFLAGQRGDEISIDTSPDTPKSIQVTFTKPKS